LESISLRALQAKARRQLQDWKPKLPDL